MPRKPTLIANQAKLELRKLISLLPGDSPLPTMRELGKRCDLHPSTMFRMLRDLATEGAVWQSPSGKFFRASARKRNLKGAPVCFIGREMWQWSRLYQEILEGVSEVCTTNGSPLILLSAASLVRQSDSTRTPRFASPAVQEKELASLLAAAPRGCCGFILDHLWCEAAIANTSFPGGERVQVLFGADRKARVISPDYRAGARLVRKHLIGHQIQDAVLIIPFIGDSAIEASMRALREELKSFALREFPFARLEKEIKRILVSAERKTWLLCPEDNTALAVSARINEALPTGLIHLMTTQGTGMIGSPMPRLRYDYRQLGRSVAGAILDGKGRAPIRPSLIAR